MGVTFVTRQSPHSLNATLDRLEHAARAAGATIFSRIDHQAAAVAVGSTLRPTTVLLFGNAKAGTPLMQQKPTIALDLPLRVLGWQDDEGRVWLTYRDPTDIAADHGLPAGDTHVVALSAALRGMINEAIG
jgi:uncharacterized protein (DUF302 family)